MALTLQIISALVTAAVLFLQAAGLTLIFGVCRVLNLAHGSFFMLALFASYWITSQLGDSALSFWAALVLVPLGSAVLGALIEITLFRPIYKAHILARVLLTIGLIYIVSDVVRLCFGLAPKGVSVPEIFAAPIQFFDIYIPSYYIFVLLTGMLTAGGIWYVVQKTSWGLLIRAASQDRDMSAALGVNQQLLFASVFAFSFGLVGLGGVLYAPIGGANLGSDIESVIEAFAVVVIGGVGSIMGSLVAALMIGAIKAFGILVLPQYSMVFVFALMAVVLIVRPHGLFGMHE